MSLEILYIIVICGLILLSMYAFFRLHRANKKSTENNIHFRQLEARVNSLHLATLESRLNPHLFKNILNSIQSHAYQTYHALDKLANVLDYILYESRKRFVTPKEEIEFAMNLIEINKIKISPLFELKVKTKIDEGEALYMQPVMAPLISIDLIENAFKHADLQSPDAFVSIIYEFRNNCFSLTVSNKISSAPVMIKEKGGIGMETLEERLRIIYGEHFELRRFADGDTYIAHLKIDFVEYQNKMSSAG